MNGVHSNVCFYILYLVFFFILRWIDISFLTCHVLLFSVTRKGNLLAGQVISRPAAVWTLPVSLNYRVSLRERMSGAQTYPASHVAKTPKWCLQLTYSMRDPIHPTTNTKKIKNKTGRYLSYAPYYATIPFPQPSEERDMVGGKKQQQQRYVATSLAAKAVVPCACAVCYSTLTCTRLAAQWVFLSLGHFLVEDRSRCWEQSTKAILPLKKNSILSRPRIISRFGPGADSYVRRGCVLLSFQYHNFIATLCCLCPKPDPEILNCQILNCDTKVYLRMS